MPPARPSLGLPRHSSLSQLRAQRPRGFVTEAITAALHANVSLAHDLLVGIHHYSALPWIVSIPLTALVVRCSVALPLQIWSLKQRDKMLKLRPIINAKRWFRRKAVLDEANINKDTIVPDEVDRRIHVEINRDIKDIYKRLGVHRFAPYAPMAQLPVWLAVMESLRRMVGAEGGILSILHRLIDPAGHEFPIPIEQSMATEGGLWFTNLLEADPHLVLPFVLSGVMFTNITWGWKVATNEQIKQMLPAGRFKARFFRGLRTAFQLVALSFGPTVLVTNVPSGLLLYWISSTTFATIQTRAFAKFWLPPKVPAQCANYGVAPAVSSEGVRHFQIIPRAPSQEVVPSSPNVKEDKRTKKRQIKRYIQQ